MKANDKSSPDLLVKVLINKIRLRCIVAFNNKFEDRQEIQCVENEQ